MARIVLTPSELLAQSTELSSLTNEYERLFSGVAGILTNLNDNWSQALSNNFSSKIISAQSSFSSIVELLGNGAATARTSAETFQSVDSLLGQKFGGAAQESVRSSNGGGYMLLSAVHAVKTSTVSEDGSVSSNQTGECISFYDWLMGLFRKKKRKKTTIHRKDYVDSAQVIAERLKNSAIELEYQVTMNRMLKDIIDNQLGDGPRKYWSWYYGYDSNRTDGWCAVFVSYYLEQAGIDVRTPENDPAYQWFRSHPDTQARYFASQGCYSALVEGYQPETGDIVFLDYDKNGSADHVGIVYVDENGEKYIVHGNWDDQVSLSKFSNSAIATSIMGYGDAGKMKSQSTP